MERHLVKASTVYFFSYLFVGDGGDTPKIERCSLTGEDRKHVVSQGILYPVSIAIDVHQDMIVWVDDMRDTVEIAKFDGTERKIIRRMSGSVFSDVAVFKVRNTIDETCSMKTTRLNFITY